MQREIIFDPMTAEEVAQRMAKMADLEKAYNGEASVLNAIMLTTARLNGCAPTDTVRLNDTRTGIVVGTAEDVPDEGANAEQSAKKAKVKEQAPV